MIRVDGLVLFCELCDGKKITELFHSKSLSEDGHTARVWEDPTRVTGKALRNKVWVFYELRFLKVALTHHCCVLGGLPEMVRLPDTFEPQSCNTR